MNGPAASLFRVELQLGSADEMKAHPVVVEGYSLLYVNVAANDADAAIAAARAIVRREQMAECARLVSVSLVARIDLLATATTETSAHALEHVEPVRSSSTA